MSTQFKNVALDPQKVSDFLLQADENEDFCKIFDLTAENYSSAEDEVFEVFSEEEVSEIIEILILFTRLSQEEKVDIFDVLTQNRHLCIVCLYFGIHAYLFWKQMNELNSLLSFN